MGGLVLEDGGEIDMGVRKMEEYPVKYFGSEQVICQRKISVHQRLCVWI